MGVFSYDRFGRSALMVCDSCDHVMTSDGGRSDRPRRDSSPDELAIHFRYREEVEAPARRAGWRATTWGGEKNAKWFCPSCQGSGTRPGG